MVAENPVYFRIGYDESLDAKKDILYSEMSLLNMVKIIKRYKAWRVGELEIKSQLFKDMKELNLAMRKIKTSLPFLNMPEEKEEKEEPQKGKKGIKVVKKGEEADEELRFQLEDIQNKLNAITNS
jgi:hypothetical protein